MPPEGENRAELTYRGHQYVVTGEAFFHWCELLRLVGKKELEADAAMVEVLRGEGGAAAVLHGAAAGELCDFDLPEDPDAPAVCKICDVTWKREEICEECRRLATSVHEWNCETALGGTD